jgi:hypothetical protein
MNRGVPNPRFIWAQGQVIEMNDDERFVGHNVTVTDSPIQLHSMEIQPSHLPAEKQTERMMEMLNHPHNSQWNRNLNIVQTVGFSVPPQPIPHHIREEREVQSSPEQIPKKKKKEKRDKSASPSSSPKGRGRYACLLHRQKHKRCPPDCPERKPKPMKSPSSVKKSPRKHKMLQINPIDLQGGSEMVYENGFPILHNRVAVKSENATVLPVERVSWDTCTGWEELSWTELNPITTWNAWEDLRSSTHWEESKSSPRVLAAPKVEFDTNQFLMEEKRLQLSDSPEGECAMTDAMGDVKMEL